ncbi:trifunctional serine/threonine-protein kinase/ATP-binding protein/sensor histidine kinase [Kamptonema animale CS-326]|jgi:predicted ATPase/signal transduction histidine kinase/tRNA A-37 threonylcarbamoyl transferase component Bud32|uniref:trifunctional serine/threonine-protein kinase/ATP-binding protein/sensor histidine kinase n=1 Tax=Kamptonema animale TaxID=92934 RepID=UPI00232E7243|nr:ATP-binding sensor histidine kinase [Kamptonema animale]MDB9513444.1 trifunctional serine/threonine-protein kinase/ATP-binding protein/sensor histidine kinase [Kamptonema animale CS-326]
MINLAGYEITDPIHESNNSLVCRGVRKQDNQPIILKFLKQDYPMPASLVRYKQEYEITRNLNLESVPKTYSLERYQNSLVIIFEDCGGESLKLFLASHKFTLEEFLSTAIKITRALGQIHQHNIIHKDINPSNIIINSITGLVQIIDFGISSVLSRENPSINNPNILEGTLTYISPEQTGRMNRVIDYRTDFYSLGVTFYELLTGQLPCDYSDAMELVHCHIAKQVVSPQEINTGIPKGIADIVMKLLAKTAEARYQSAWGIIADLEECLTQLQTKGEIADFAIAQKDITDKFQIPQKLYGREREVETLLSAFDRVSNGMTEIMLVSGYSGIGKSALVQEVYKPITKARGYFIAGKFDQFQRNIPYSAIVKAFQSLVKQLLTESETQLAAWKEKLLAAFGDNGQIVIDVIPDVELIVGQQQPVQELGATEAQNRFNLVFQKFIRVFCSVDHPLTIFLDDLQWADSATLKLLQVMMADEETKYLFLIGAYRDNEVNPTHPLIMTLEGLQNQGVTINQITLTPLDIEHIAKLIADTVRMDRGSIMPLAELVVGKTQGNPFFVNQFLRTLYEENLLNFNLQKRNWDWNISEIEAVGITDNVVELMLGKLRKMPNLTQQVLRLAACVGNSFDLNTISIVNEKSTSETFQELFPAIQDGLILATSELGVTEKEIFKSSLVITNYKFLHDRVQQAAYTLIEKTSKKIVHLQIGRLLWQNISTDMRTEEIFAIVDHLNLGIELVSDECERIELAKLNLIAGQKAKAAMAYAAATEYLQVGLQLLAKDSWTHNYELTLALHEEAAEAAFLRGDFEGMQRFVEIVQNCAKTLLDKVKVYEVQIQAYMGQNRLVEAVNRGLQVLKLLEVEFPFQPNPSDIGQALGETAAILKEKRIEDLVDLPRMTDPYKLAAVRLMSSIFAPAYIAAPALLPLTVCKQVDLSVQYGNASVSPFAYANYGFLLCGVLGDIDSGYQFGQLALSLVSKLNAQEIKAKTAFIVNLFIRHCKEHLRETLEPLVSAYSTGIETGDLEYAGYSLLQSSCSAYYSGKELTVLKREIAINREAIYKIKQETALNYIEIYEQAILNLLGESENSCILKGEACDEELKLPLYQQANDKVGVAYIYLNKILLCYWFENYAEAIENTARAEKYLDAVVGMPIVTIFHFYDSLVWLAVYSDTPQLEQQGILDRVQANQEKMDKWAHHAPMNYLHKFYLVEAEWYRVLGEKVEAMEMYDKAIALAKENKYIHEEALAYELAAKFYLSWGKETIAQVYMQNAHYSYQLWGAIAKVEDLQAKYPQFLARTSAKTTTQTKVNRTTTVPTTTSTNLRDTLDLATVMKASQAISGEIVLSKLLERLMKIAIENAGAEKGFLILEKAGNWAIEAEGSVKKDEVSVLRSLPLNAKADSEEIPKLASAIANYVIRTQENVVLNNATQEGQFTRDPYIAATQPKSILCTPLIHQGKLTGILYLENNLTEGAFTTDRLELLKLLSAQIAISIENAQLYNNLQEFNQNLEQLVGDRTQELSNTLDALKATQSKLVESEKMASLGGLVAGVAHEINTPVGVGVTVASALAEHTTEFASIYNSGKMKRSELEEFLDIAIQSSNTLLTNLNQAAALIQSFKEVAVDRSSEERRTFRVRDYLDEILIQLKPKLRNSKHSLKLNGDPQIAIDSYPGALSQVATNLLMNSLIHAYEPGESGQLVFNWQQEGERLSFEYSDDGQGIPPENLSKIFEPFFTTKRGQGGSGLGLHIVYNLVTQKLRGEIECKSEVGEGTKFIIKLPLQIDSKP